MSGITGWIDYERVMPQERPTLRAMTAALAARGPDAEGVWVGACAGLGHRRLALVDRSRGAQPMVAEGNGRPVAVVVLDGSLYNFRELSTDLAARGHRFRTESDAEVVLRAYLEWGADCVRRLDGMFGLAIWDPRRQELILARDRLGVKPLYYARAESGLLFGSEPKALLANPLVEPAVDADGLREILTFAATPGRSIFRGIAKVRPGHVLTFNRSGLNERAYWQLEAGPHVDSLETTIANVRRLLVESVARQAGRVEGLGVMLSGGLDSSAITALAARAVAAEDNGPLRSYTVSFTGHREHFTPDQVRTTSDDVFVAEVSDHVGAEHTTVELSTSALMDPVARALTIRAKDLPAPLGDMNISLYVFCRAVRELASVVMVGESADSLFGGNVWTKDPALAHSDTFPWIAMAQQDGASFTLGSGLLRADLLKDIDVLGFGIQSRQQVNQEAPVLPDSDVEERRMRRLSYLHLSRFAEYQNTHCDAITANVGLQARLPFADYRLWEYVYNVPWAMQSFDGREKSLLRAAVADLLPRSVVERRKSPFPITRDPQYDVALRTALAEVVADVHAPVNALLDRQAARQLATDSTPWGARGWLIRTDIEMVLAMDFWLRAYGLRLQF